MTFRSEHCIGTGRDPGDGISRPAGWDGIPSEDFYRDGTGRDQIPAGRDGTGLDFENICRDGIGRDRNFSGRDGTGWEF